MSANKYFTDMSNSAGNDQLFYLAQKAEAGEVITLPEDVSRHIGASLRKAEGEKIKLTDGLGNFYPAIIRAVRKKEIQIEITGKNLQPRSIRHSAIAISLLKNSGRFEWFLEKATELGITEIIPLICSRTERQNIRFDRLKSILANAVTQSLQAWMPHLNEPISFDQFISGKGFAHYDTKLIAHCVNEEKQSLNALLKQQSKSAIILIGPEGDFSTTEIESATQKNFISITLGPNRLRTETAGIVAATFLSLYNENI